VEPPVGENVGRRAAQAAAAVVKAALDRSGTPLVTVTPCNLRQLVYAANAALFLPRAKPPPNPPLGRRPAQAFSAAANFGLLAKPPPRKPLPPPGGTEPPPGVPPVPDGGRPENAGRVTPCWDRHFW
jgi:hypothetical protein